MISTSRMELQQPKTRPKPGERGYSREFLVGVWRLVLQILTRFLTKERKEEKKKKKKCYLHTKIHNRTIIMASYFQTRTLKSIPVLRPGLFWQKLCYHYLDQRANKKNSNPFGIRIFLFLSFSFGIETINTPQFPRNPYPFSDQNGAKTY